MAPRTHLLYNALIAHCADPYTKGNREVERNVGVSAFGFIIALIVLAALVVLGVGAWLKMSETVETTEADLRKYPEIQLFIVDMKTFVPGEADLDVGTFSFGYGSGQPKERVFERIDAEAVRQGWTPVGKTEFKISYRKNLQRSAVQHRDDVVTVVYQEDTGTFHVFWK